MKNLVLQAKHKNWSLTTPESWQYTQWKIYDDLTMEVSTSYGLEIKKKQVKITQKDYDLILDLSKQSEKEDKDVMAFDGSAWEIKRYQGETKVWERELGYIYGIKPLEALAKALYDMAEIENTHR